MAKKHSFGELIVDFIELLFISAIVFIVVYFFVGQLLEVSGDSMKPTLIDKERIIAEKLSLKYKDLQRGEIVIFVNPQYPEQDQKLIIKRVIGLPGEIITISDSKVYINDEPIDEPYLAQGMKTVKPIRAFAASLDYPAA